MCQSFVGQTLGRPRYSGPGLLVLPLELPVVFMCVRRGGVGGGLSWNMAKDHRTTGWPISSKYKFNI